MTTAPAGLLDRIEELLGADGTSRDQVHMLSAQIRNSAFDLLGDPDDYLGDQTEVAITLPMSDWALLITAAGSGIDREIAANSIAGLGFALVVSDLAAHMAVSRNPVPVPAAS